MSLFEVPGWSVPSAPVSQNLKKRKRPVSKDAEGVDEAERMHAAQKNIEKLMRSLGSKVDALDREQGFEKPEKKKKESRGGKEKKEKVQEVRAKEGAQPKGSAKSRKQDKGQARDKASQSQKEGDIATKSAIDSKSNAIRDSPSEGKKKQGQRQKQQQHRADAPDAIVEAVPAHEESPPSPPKPSVKAKAKGANSEDGGLTALQASMKKSLDGARFRWINEMLYKSDSAKAHELMSNDPAVFSDYHTGFRHQVESWPTNPVSHYISILSSYPAKTVIADLGCGDAALARALVPKGMTILSFDLISDGAYVVEADTCAHIPLPGSENNADGEGAGQVVDVVVCALSLMGTNWPGCIREAWRILRSGGELKVAEVTSRFTDVGEFVSFVSSLGFKLQSKDERNTHFTLFEFVKVSRKPKSEKEWSKLMSRGTLLKPCEYKRR